MSPDCADCCYDLKRAEQEAILAIRSASAPVAAVHEELCLRYSGRVIAMLIARAVDRRWQYAAEAIEGS